MENADSARPLALLDWIVLTVRWVFLIIVGLSLATHADMTWALLFVILGLVLNVIATILVVLNHMAGAMRLVYVIFDLVFALALFYIADINLRLTWVSLLPLLTAALFFQWIGAIVVTLIALAVQVAMIYILTPEQDIVRFLAVWLPVYLVVGLAVAFTSRRLSKGSQIAGRGARGGTLRAGDRKERERRRAIYELITALSASLNYQKVLQTSLELSANTLTELDAPADKLVSAVLLFTQSDRHSPELAVASSRMFLPGDRSATLPGVEGLVSHVIDEGSSALSKDLSKDPELSRLGSLRNCTSAYCIPLRSGLDAYGVLLFTHPDADFFTLDRREVLDIIGNQSVVAIQNARLYQDLEQEKNRMMEIQEESRKKLARDLHDGPTQSISAIAMRVNFARRLLEKDTKSAAEELYKIEELARRTTKEIRHMLFTLRPLVLESQGLVAALQSMSEKMKETFNQEVVIQADQRAVDAMETGKQAVVFYITEEAVNNARKHARADHVWVRLKMLRDNICLLEIEDDGVGFDVNAVGASYESRGSLGMINLKERSELVNGILRIDSVKGRGTRIQVIIPLSEEAADLMRRGK
jgi:signal transduction histidine kinase